MTFIFIGSDRMYLSIAGERFSIESEADSSKPIWTFLCHRNSR